ncbi:hypothetical protein MPTK1_3g04650 [Marchantia polymorpha subsp. ruderalis]|uniref:Fungal lipase-like domain-containing protein n=2 Tax=Marchantia polymorpha TaxID=3197 RepID=A0AAF6AXF8_MARPO|nr:hypothetical protein MARPO_0022s0064 [Marchantia polymorpha]BBN04442.1 hypothetical protein Mp_3g04650 [Marchantia polymorpha subsp. ruderalis]|eukprot:PTQ43960.1 hypothetical protein MARPO_0022s0064 [Marchantia polymorpha]
MYDRFKGNPQYEKWWTDVHYRLIPVEEVLTEYDRNRYATELSYANQHKYLGVFRRKEEDNEVRSDETPHWVVAIRGTHPLNWADLKNDFRIFVETLNSSKTITILEAVVRSLGEQHGYRNVIVTGHSLGAAKGLLVCRRLALEGSPVEGHFFNPPFTTLSSVAGIFAHVVKHGITKAFPAQGENLIAFGKRVASAGIELFYGLADTERRRKQKALEEFQALAKIKWSPYLYVHKYDLICRQFLSHFRKAADEDYIAVDQKKWYSSFSPLTNRLLGETESFHLFPSAYVVKIEDRKLLARPLSAHMLWNWLDPHVSRKFEKAVLLHACMEWAEGRN